MSEFSKKIACIGSGNMGKALMKGAARVINGKNIIFTDHSPEKARAAAAAIGGAALSSNAEAVKTADIVFFAVKPQGIPALINETAAAFTGGKVLVSMAAGVSLAQIERDFAAQGANMPALIRIMPNTSALLGKGVIALAAAQNVPQPLVEEVRTLLSGSGAVDIAAERLIDAATALSGCGPAFVYLFLEALADGGVLAGLPREKALRYAALTVEGAALMALQSGKHSAALKDEVASPGGATIAGIAALEERGFRGSVIAAVKAAFERAKELA